ncbi:MAG: OB-fold nucleic acid binding domain-containing protein [Nanoarchaeota archaeon]|nr:OB-fold nucleic acid binding domain-containing protein [Nanoarchaeota archaeon]
MEEKTVKLVSIMVIIIGLTFLFFYSQKLELPVTEELGNSASETVMMKGTVSNLRVTDKAVFFELEGEKVVKTEIILFPDNSIYLRDGDQVEITGQVEEYKGKKEVVADKMVLK